MNIYLDNAATTPLPSPVKDYIVSLLDEYGNPSSMYDLGFTARDIVAEARSEVAKFINANENEIIFTSGGSAANTLAIKGYHGKRPYMKIAYSPIAHKSILSCFADENECDGVPLSVDDNGMIDVYKLEQKLWFANVGLVVVDYANSEVGTIQDVESIIRIAHEAGALVYLDCTGSIPYIHLDVKALDVDMAGFSAHKLGGLKGCGVLYKKPSIALQSLIGGSQEQGLFAGTENVLGIASLGKAVQVYDYDDINSRARDYVRDYIFNHFEDVKLIGNTVSRLPQNLYVCFKGVKGAQVISLLDSKGIQASTGSACNNYSKQQSHTLQQLGVSEDYIDGGLRLTFSGKETEEELEYVCQTIDFAVNALRRLS